MEFCAITDKGIVRKQNQDTFLDCYNEKGTALILGVFDGMGGAKSGNVASILARDTFLEVINNNELEQGKPLKELSKVVKLAVSQANSAVYSLSLTDVKYKGMGTTIVAALVVGDDVVVANVGDSRA